MSEQHEPPRRECATGACADCDLGDACPSFVAPAVAERRTEADDQPERLVVYIAGPISSDASTRIVFANLRRFFVLEAKLMKMGFAPINPAADFIAIMEFADEDFDAEPFWNALMGKDRAILRRCDALYLLDGWGQSRGAVSEVGWALEADVPVFQSLAELVAYRESLSVSAAAPGS